jgi:hypothetical protein
VLFALGLKSWGTGGRNLGTKNEEKIGKKLGKIQKDENKMRNSCQCVLRIGV